MGEEVLYGRRFVVGKAGFEATGVFGMFLLLGDVTEDGLQVSHPFVHWSDRSVIVFSSAVSKDMLLKLTCLRRILVMSDFSLK